ncbi:MAG: HAMP domain-containing histidine kinase [Lachnospiraceae bacterium]|nr:HAMP domain-containing histidine kinase [Lachnospiraceae bacterium]
MRGSLKKKLAVSYLFIAAILFLLVNTVYAKRVEEKVFAKREQRLYEETDMIIDGYVERYYTNRITITRLMTDITPISELLNVRLWITAPWGKVVGDTAPLNGKVIEFSELDEDFEEFLSETFHRNVYFRGAMEEPMLVVVVPITYQYMVRGYVCTLVTMESVMQEARTYIYYMNLYYLAAMLVVLLVFIVIYCFMVLPLKKTISAARAYSLWNFEKKFTVRSKGEYRELADIINYMGDAMYRFSEYQREIISNISHDFRSPLTSIKGYAEAIKDGTIPPEQQEKYLDVVLFEVERLTKLTSNLLTLNTFDQKGIPLQASEFDINDVIKKLVNTFEGMCKKKRLVIQLLFSEKETFVYADPGKIEQVIYNLVDNAIKFSHSYGEIQISVEEKGKKAMVSIKDGGIGITKEDLSKIWDRFYKSDSSRGKDRKGTGLGLSIVKEIITAHKENINVISTEGVGTEFVFTLPLVISEEI